MKKSHQFINLTTQVEMSLEFVLPSVKFFVTMLADKQFYIRGNKKGCPEWFMKATRLFPDPEWEIEVYETFWEIESEVEKCVPPLLVYADLIINEDKRSIETANIIYEKYLKEF